MEGRNGGGVAASVANDVAVAFAAAARQALGTDEHVHLSAVYLALGLNSPEHSWALAVLRLSDRVTRQLPHRLPLAAYQAALSDGRQPPRTCPSQTPKSRALGPAFCSEQFLQTPCHAPVKKPMSPLVAYKTQLHRHQARAPVLRLFLPFQFKSMSGERPFQNAEAAIGLPL